MAWCAGCPYLFYATGPGIAPSSPPGLCLVISTDRPATICSRQLYATHYSILRRIDYHHIPPPDLLWDTPRTSRFLGGCICFQLFMVYGKTTFYRPLPFYQKGT